MITDPTKPIVDRLRDLEARATRAGVRWSLSEGWRELRDLIPDCDRKQDVEAFSDPDEWGKGKTGQRLFREALGRLGVYMEGWEAGRASRPS